MENINIGDIVEAEYKTGIYIGEVIEDRHRSFLVQVQAVKKHPTQGDLHNPGKVKNIAFHERKALAFKEKTNAPKRKVKLYLDIIPSYAESLKKAVEDLKQNLKQENSKYSEAALHKISNLESDFYHKVYEHKKS